METSDIIFKLFSLATENKDVFATIWNTGVTFFMMWFFYWLINKLMSQQEKNIERIVNSVGKHIIDDMDNLLGLGERAVRSATTPKLNFLRKRLIQNDIHNNQHIIKHHIRTSLNKISRDGYISFLNNFNTRGGLMGDWIAENFDMEDFLKEVYKVFFNREMTIDRKIELIESIMQEFQTKMWDDFRLLYNK